MFAFAVRRLLNTISCSAALAISLLAPQPVAAQAVQGVTDKEILLGAVSDLSGPLAALGSFMRDGMTLGAEEINDAGGIYGRRIRIATEDAAYDPKKAVLAAQKLVMQDKVFALIGTIGSVSHLASQNIALDRGVPVLFPIIATNGSYLPKHPLKFGYLGTGDVAMRVSISYLYKLGRRNFALIYQDDEKGQLDMRVAEAQLKELGLSLVEKASHKRGEINFSSQVAKVKAAKPDALLLGVLPRESGAIAIEAKSQGWQGDMVVVSSPSTISIDIAKTAMEGVYGTSSVSNDRYNVTPAVTAMYQRYKVRFNRDWDDGIGIGYSLVMLFAEGAKKAGKNLTPQTLSQGLEQVRDFKTIFDIAPITYSSDYHGPPQTTYILQVQNGRWTKIAGPLSY